MLTMVERVLILKGADLLRDVGPRHLLRLAEVAREIELWKGEIVYDESDPADALYMVVEGRVRLTRGTATSDVGPGEAFGTWALVDDSDRGHRVEGLEDGLALALSRDDFYDVAAADVVLLQEVLRALAKRMRALVADRPEEARIEGEGVEKPEAVEIAESAAADGAETPSAGTRPEAESHHATGGTLAAAALGQPAPEAGESSPSTAASIPSEEIATPEPIAPIEPPTKPRAVDGRPGAG
jgi:CRP-like cAMP-binding protein